MLKWFKKTKKPDVTIPKAQLDYLLKEGVIDKNQYDKLQKISYPYEEVSKGWTVIEQDILKTPAKKEKDGK